MALTSHGSFGINNMGKLYSHTTYRFILKRVGTLFLPLEINLNGTESLKERINLLGVWIKYLPLQVRKYILVETNACCDKV